MCVDTTQRADTRAIKGRDVILMHKECSSRNPHASGLQVTAMMRTHREGFLHRVALHHYKELGEVNVSIAVCVELLHQRL